MIRAAVIGNPNVGKTEIFNRLIGLSHGGGKWLDAYALVLGVGYGAAALAEAIGNPEIFPGGLLSIAVLLAISATYLMGVKGLTGAEERAFPSSWEDCSYPASWGADSTC